MINMLGGEKSSGTKTPPQKQQQYKTKHKNQKNTQQKNPTMFKQWVSKYLVNRFNKSYVLLTIVIFYNFLFLITIVVKYN